MPWSIVATPAATVVVVIFVCVVIVCVFVIFVVSVLISSFSSSSSVSSSSVSSSSQSLLRRPLGRHRFFVVSVFPSFPSSSSPWSSSRSRFSSRKQTPILVPLRPTIAPPGEPVHTYSPRWRECGLERFIRGSSCGRPDRFIRGSGVPEGTASHRSGVRGKKNCMGGNQRGRPYSARVNKHTGYCRWQRFACEGAHSSSYNACGCAGAHTNYRSPCSGRQSGACRRCYIRGTGAHHYGSNGISASTKETAGLARVHQSRRHGLVECRRPDSCYRPHHCFLSH